MRAKPPTASATPHSRAWLTCEENLEAVKHMVELGTREMELAEAEARRFGASLTKMQSHAAKERQAKAVRSGRRFMKKLEVRLARFKTATLWQVVMLVTCVETYLQDLLCLAASVDPELMSKSEQIAPYGEVIAATSLDQLANELRARWARSWLSEGGPIRWTSRLGKMGARGYPADLGPRLELMWGIRHVVVHGAGIASADFVKRHPGVVAAAGDRVRVSSKDFRAFVVAVKGLVEPTEAYFLERYPSLRVSPTLGTEP